MLLEKYKKAYTEVLEIISYFPEEEYNKIPKEEIEFYKKNMDINYDYKINPEIDLSEQNVSREAYAILVSIFRDYFATEKQKEILKNLLNQNQEKLDEAKRNKYNPDDIFNKKNKQTIDNNIQTNELQIIKYKQSFFCKFIKFIKKVLNLK